MIQRVLQDLVLNLFKFFKKWWFPSEFWFINILSIQTCQSKLESFSISLLLPSSRIFLQLWIVELFSNLYTPQTQTQTQTQTDTDTDTDTDNHNHHNHHHTLPHKEKNFCSHVYLLILDSNLRSWVGLENWDSRCCWSKVCVYSCLDWLYSLYSTQFADHSTN
jgi:hypothetical protein